MEKWTKGPWRYFKQGDGTRFHITARPATKPGNRFDDFATVDIGHEDDARLIASAPLLYDELAHLVRLLEPLERDGTLNVPGLATLNGARAALSRATGEEGGR